MAKQLKLPAYLAAARIARALHQDAGAGTAVKKTGRKRRRLELHSAMDRKPWIQHTFLRDEANEAGVMAVFGVCLRADHCDHVNVAYIYGAAGTGKTTILQATAQLLRDVDPDFQAPILSSEDFYQDVVTAYQMKSFDKFKRAYRKPDWLMLDGIHHLKNKQRTQEELLHLLDHRERAGKVTIFTANVPPGELVGIDESLLSKILSGPVAQIHAPTPKKPADLDENWGEGSKANVLPADEWHAILDAVGHDLRTVRSVLATLWVERTSSDTPPLLDEVLQRFARPTA